MCNDKKYLISESPNYKKKNSIIIRQSTIQHVIKADKKVFFYSLFNGKNSSDII